MEHSLPALQSARPWRTATLVVSALAVLELVVLVVAGLALLQRPVSKAAQERAFTPISSELRKRQAPGAPKLLRSETSVIVLNGNGRTGAASGTAERVRGRGYIVSSVGNANRTDYARSLVMYRRGYRAEAARLARDLQIKIVGPLDGLKRRDLLGAHLALIVGA